MLRQSYRNKEARRAAPSRAASRPHLTPSINAHYTLDLGDFERSLLARPTNANRGNPKERLGVQYTAAKVQGEAAVSGKHGTVRGPDCRLLNALPWDS